MTRMTLSNSFRLNPLQLGFVLIASCCAVAASAQTAPAKDAAAAAKGLAISWIGDLDTNHDGRVSKQEAAAAPAIAKAFDQIDTNKDGNITMSEVRVFWRNGVMTAAQAAGPGLAAAFAKADANHDGKLSEAEAKAGMPRMSANFKTLDTNKDGSLGKDEVAASANMAAQARLGQKRQAEGQLFTKADTNKDGKLSQAEFTAAFPKLAPDFAFFDENHDGSVAPDEFALPPR